MPVPVNSHVTVKTNKSYASVEMKSLSMKKKL